MSNITDWVKYELYPSLFNSINIAFPEHNFKQHYGDWKSKTYLDGKPHKDRTDKTVVTKKAPGLILEQGGEVVGLVDYTMRRDNVDFITAVKTLAEVSGIQLPKSSSFDTEAYHNYKDQAILLEDCNNYFSFCLENSKGAEEVRAYLTSRGYLDTDIKAMELGYIPSQDKLFKYLQDKGYDKTLIDEVVTIKADTRIGATHNLTLPYRSGGSIKGFKFRTITEALPKYLNSKGLDRNGGFFNLLGVKGDKDIVIVEGELDSLSATVRGVDNVVATGGSSIASEQIKDALKRGAKRFTICFDNEPDKEEETNKKTIAAIEIILAEGVNNIYITTLPDLGEGKTDPDRLIQESGIDSFKIAIAEALPYSLFKLNITLNKFHKIIEDQGGLSHKEIDNLKEEIVTEAANLSPMDKDRYKAEAMAIFKELNITEESLDITIEKLTTTKNKEAQAKEFNKLLTEVTRLQSQGEVSKALELLDNGVNKVKLKDKATEFSSLLLPIKEEELRKRLINKPDSLNSGYTIGGEPLLLPSGAITVLSAPTSHGKTTFLINLALNIAQAYPDKEAYLFSYEEDSDSILINALNTYLDTAISGNNRTTLRNYFTGDNSRSIEGKDKFFKELIDTKRLNIHYSNYSSDTLIEAIRYLHKHANPGAIFIDYIQLLNLPEGKYKTYSRQEEIKQICIALKDIAVETGLPIILGAQFNREVTSLLKIHATKIGEAGDIERIANLIIGFWNNNFKPLAATEGEINEVKLKGGFTKDTIYTTVLKNRGGVVGMEELLTFNGNTGKISNKKENIKPISLSVEAIFNKPKL